MKLWNLAAVVSLAGTMQLAAAESLLKIDQGASSIEIEGKAFGFIPATFAFEDFGATVVLQEGDLELERAEITFAYDTITSGGKARDRKIREWLEADRFPEGSFRLQRKELVGDERYAIGTLRLHGQSGEARFRYALVREGRVVTLTAEATIDYRKWGLPDLRVLFFKVRPELEIRLRLAGEAS